MRSSRQAAVYMARGGPGRSPVERPNKLEFVVNLRSAKAIGIELPNSILLRADEVIA